MDQLGREEILLAVGLFLVVMTMAALIWNSRLSRRARFWRDVAHMDGIRKFSELPDGDYRLVACQGVVGSFSVWRVTFSPIGGAGCTRVMTLVAKEAEFKGHCFSFLIENGEIADTRPAELTELPPAHP